MNENCQHDIIIIEFNVDDMVPQHIPYFMERLFFSGASDVFVTPIIMKKGRPGYLFTISCTEKNEKQIIEIVFFETTTIGVKKRISEGIKIQTRVFTTKCSFGEIKVKELSMDSGKKKVVPEFTECQEIAERMKLPICEVQTILQKELNE